VSVSESLPLPYVSTFQPAKVAAPLAARPVVRGKFLSSATPNSSFVGNLRPIFAPTPVV